MINRKLDLYIEHHFETSKTALLLKGARQTGKTFAIRKFAMHHKYNLIEINFDEDASAKNIFAESASASDVLLRISAHTNKKTSLPKTLIFLDEIQKCPQALTWIKFLVDEGSCSYALSGSLLGVELNDVESYPVGYLTIKEVFPLDLEEFARALGLQDNVFEAIKMAWEQLTPVDDVVHKAMIKMVQLYLVVGGMPAAVQAYLDTNDLNIVEERQRDVLKLYRLDISKYDPAQKFEIDEIFRLLPSELDSKNKRFILKKLNEHARFSRYENGFIWLKNAGVAIPVYNITEPVIPLKLNQQRNLLKLFQNDVGLLACQYASGLQIKLLSGDININYGAIYENLVAQELNCHGFGGDEHELYYYNNKKQGELDFIIEYEGRVLPIEVKSGKDYERHNALCNVLGNAGYGIINAYVLCNGNVEVNGNRVYLPIYMLMFLNKFPTAKEQIFHLDLSSL